MYYTSVHERFPNGLESSSIAENSREFQFAAPEIQNIYNAARVGGACTV